jgi:hypothetical protein
MLPKQQTIEKERRPIEVIQAFRISEFCEAYGISKWKFYEEVSTGRLKVIKRGRAVFIPKENAAAWAGQTGGAK